MYMQIIVLAKCIQLQITYVTQLIRKIIAHWVAHAHGPLKLFPNQEPWSLIAVALAD